MAEIQIPQSCSNCKSQPQHIVTSGAGREKEKWVGHGLMMAGRTRGKGSLWLFSLHSNGSNAPAPPHLPCLVLVDDGAWCLNQQIIFRPRPPVPLMLLLLLFSPPPQRFPMIYGLLFSHWNPIFSQDNKSKTVSSYNLECCWLVSLKMVKSCVWALYWNWSQAVVEPYINGNGNLLTVI